MVQKSRAHQGCQLHTTRLPCKPRHHTSECNPSIRGNSYMLTVWLDAHSHNAELCVSGRRVNLTHGKPRPHHHLD